MSEGEFERLVKARDEAWADERVAFGTLLGAKQATDAAWKAWEEARVVHADKFQKGAEADSAVEAYLATH